MRRQATAGWELARAERRRAIGRVLVGLAQAVAIVLGGWLFLTLLLTLV